MVIHEKKTKEKKRKEKKRKEKKTEAMCYNHSYHTQSENIA